MREERGIVALMTVAFLTLLGIVAIAFVLSAAKINNSYTLLNNAAQSAAFSAITSATVDQSGKAVIPCPRFQEVRETLSGCGEGDAYAAARDLLQATFQDNPSGFCFSEDCPSNGTPVYLGERESSWIQAFNTVDSPESESLCTREAFSVSRDALMVEGTEDSGQPQFFCWVVRQGPEDSPYSIRYSSGVVVRLESKIDLFLFGDPTIRVYAGAAISQGE